MTESYIEPGTINLISLGTSTQIELTTKTLNDQLAVTSFILGKAPISWQSKQQATVAFSSCEVEYMAITQAIKEAIWLQKLLKEFDSNIYCNVPTKI